MAFTASNMLTCTSASRRACNGGGSFRSAAMASTWSVQSSRTSARAATTHISAAQAMPAAQAPRGLLHGAARDARRRPAHLGMGRARLAVLDGRAPGPLQGGPGEIRAAVLE